MCSKWAAEDYFPDIIEAFKVTGGEVVIKKKKPFGKVEMVRCVTLPDLFAGKMHSLDIWSKDYFLQLADMIVYK